jgi:hypothetical protein
MSDLLQRARKAKTVASDPSSPKWRRLSQGLQAFSGLELTRIRDDVSERLEADLVRVNRVLGQYTVETVEDYQSISDVDLQHMLNIVDAASSRTIAAELDRIVADLDAGVKTLPLDALREAREHRDLMVPRLVEVLRNTASAAREGNIPDGNAHFFAIFLLTELQAEEAFPVILEVFSLPAELPFDLFGDAVTSTLAKILALFAGDRPEVLDALIGDRALNEYVRWEAAQTYVYLVRDGRLQRDDAVRRLRQQLRHAIDQNDELVIGGLICVLVSFAPKEALEDIAEAYQRDLVDSSLVDFGTVEQSITEGEARVRKELACCPATGIADTIEELLHWAAFAEKPAQQPAPLSPPPNFAAPLEPAATVMAPVSSRGPRIGRNDPCTCGSGKKFKKCCGARK